jgi:hypothetical protein
MVVAEVILNKKYTRKELAFMVMSEVILNEKFVTSER